MRFETQAEFIAFLRGRTETKYTFSFLPGSKYPIDMSVSVGKDRLIMTEVKSEVE